MMTNAEPALRTHEWPILVTGGSGRLGRMVLTQLLDRYGVPPRHVIATTRRPERLQALARRGVLVREADFNRPEGLVHSFTGARRALIISVSFEVPYVVGWRARLHRAAIEASREAGVSHLLYMSAPNAEPGNPAFWHADHYASELAVLASGATWTILRVWDWPQIHYQLFWRHALETGRYYSASGRGGINYLAKEDTAAALAAALLSDHAVNRRFDLTGPEVLSVEDVFRVLERITGRHVTVTSATLDEWERHHRPQDLEDGYMTLWRAHVAAQRGGWFGGSTNAVEELTGQRPRALHDYLARFVIPPHRSSAATSRPMPE